MLLPQVKVLREQIIVGGGFFGYTAGGPLGLFGGRGKPVGATLSASLIYRGGGFGGGFFMWFGSSGPYIGDGNCM